MQQMWQPELETLPRPQIEALQLKRIRETVARVHERVPFYKERLDAAGVRPDQINSFGDFRRIPFTVKEDFRRNYPFGLLAVPRREVVRVHASSGTTGKSTVVGYTRKDLEMWSDMVARFLVMAGVTQDSVVQVAFGYGLFTGGFGLHYGAERVGATVVPAASGNTRRRLARRRALQHVAHIIKAVLQCAGKVGVPWADTRHGDRALRPFGGARRKFRRLLCAEWL